MNEPDLQTQYLLAQGWIQHILCQHGKEVQPVSTLAFSRLPRYFEPRILACTRVALVPKVPIPPASIGPFHFSDSQRPELPSVTYLDTYFVRADHARSESLHFHELVHIIQWRVLGPDRFLSFYTDDPEPSRQRENPLEAMANSLESRFNHDAQPFDVATVCRSLIHSLLERSNPLPPLQFADNLCRTPPPQPGLRETQPTPNPTNTPRRILVVDDERDIREVSATVLTKFGYRVDMAEDGVAAWEALQAQHYDLLLTDNKMPKLSGIELIEKVRAQSIAIRIVMATGGLPTSDLDRLSDLRVSAVLEKPFTAGQLLGSLRKAFPAAASAANPAGSGLGGSPPTSAG